MLTQNGLRKTRHVASTALTNGLVTKHQKMKAHRRSSMTVPDEAVEAAARAMAQFDEWEHVSADQKSHLRRTAKRALAAAAPFIAAQATADVTALIDEAESRHGSSMYCKVTAYELRKALGQDVADWPKRSEA
jgi:hypothetical protein